MIIDLFLFFRDLQEQLESQDHMELLDEGFVSSLSSRLPNPHFLFSMFQQNQISSAGLGFGSFVYVCVAAAV